MSSKPETGNPVGQHDTYRNLVLSEFAPDFRVGFFLTYFRNFTIPSIAHTLVGAGEIVRAPKKRSYDTAIVIYELITAGLEGPRSDEMVQLLRRVHRGVPGTAADYRYVLLTLLVVPFDYIGAFSTRQPNEDEKSAAYRFFAELGTRIGVPMAASSYSEAEAEFREYERKRVSRSDDGVRLFNLTVGLYEERLPRFVRPFARTVLSVLFNDASLRRALDLGAPSKFVQVLVRTTLKVNARLKRSAKPSFEPGRSGSSVYPDGYALSDLGPK